MEVVIIELHSSLCDYVLMSEGCDSVGSNKLKFL